MHLLSGQPVAETMQSGGKAVVVSTDEIADLRSRVAALESEVAELRRLIQEGAGQ
jgi:uncharacterized protein YceH (UPF0502 family)